MRHQPALIIVLILLSLGASRTATAMVGDSWESIRVADSPFALRYSFGLATFQGRLWATGGVREVDEENCIPDDFCPFSLVYYDDLWRSDDGVAWERVYEHAPFGERLNPRMFVFQDHLYVFGGNRSNKPNVYRSADGIQWAPLNTTLGDHGYFPVVVLKDNVIIVGGGLYSEDGYTWIERTPYVSAPFNRLTLSLVQAAVLGDYVYAFQSGHVWRSPDGYNWTELAGNTEQLLVPDETSVAMDAFSGYLWLGGRFTRSSGFVWRSLDGVDWTLVRSDSDVLSLGMAMSALGDRLYILGSGVLPNVVTTTADCHELLGTPHTADRSGCGTIGLGELLRGIQFFSVGSYHCDVAGEDGYAPGPAPEVEGALAEGNTDDEPAPCVPYSSDYAPQDWKIGLNELLRLIQLYNAGSYTPCPNRADTEDGFCIGGESAGG